MVVLAALRAGVYFCRRYATATVGIRVEAHMRGLLYDGYLRYPRAFYDRQPTGQVVSRATNDLYPIRYFVGWGSVQAIQSAITIWRRRRSCCRSEPGLALSRPASRCRSSRAGLALRERLSHLAGHPAAGGRHGVRRGVGRRHRDGAGVRPRGHGARAVRRTGDPVRDASMRRVRRGALPARAVLPAALGSGSCCWSAACA